MKYKSYAFWTSLSAALVVLVGAIAKLFGFETDEKLVGDVIMGVCGVLIVFGVVKMPTQKQQQQENQNPKDEDI
jgi:uncharacterized membrane protein